MSDESSTRRNNALDFLDELDERHDFLLDELEQLNVRIDSVLNEYTKSRQSSAAANGITIEHSSEALATNGVAVPCDASNPSNEAVDFD